MRTCSCPTCQCIVWDDVKNYDISGTRRVNRDSFALDVLKQWSRAQKSVFFSQERTTNTETSSNDILGPSSPKKSRLGD